MITLDKLTGSENYQSWADSMDTFGLLVMDVRIILLLRTQVFLKINILNGKKPMLYFAIFFEAYKTCYTLWNQVKKLYTNDIQRLYRIISSIANLK